MNNAIDTLPVVHLRRQAKRIALVHGHTEIAEDLFQEGAIAVALLLRAEPSAPKAVQLWKSKRAMWDAVRKWTRESRPQPMQWQDTESKSQGFASFVELRHALGSLSTERGWRFVDRLLNGIRERGAASRKERADHAETARLLAAQLGGGDMSFSEDEVPNGFVLGSLCERGHAWQGQERSIRNLRGQCRECARQSAARHRERKRKALAPGISQDA